MDNYNYDIKIINDREEEIVKVLNELEDSEDNTIYDNCISYLRVGDKVLYIQFPTALLSEDKNKLVLLVKNGLITPKEFKILLDNKKIPYNEITFIETMPLSQNIDKEICFAQDENSLRDALRKSKEKGIDECNYYPGIHGKFELRYQVDYESGEKEPFIRQALKGAITLDDKIVLLMSDAKKKNITPSKVCDIIFSEGVIPRMISGDKTIPEREIKQYKKEL